MLQVRARGGLACDVLVNGGLSGSKEADFLADAVGLAWPFRTGDRRAASGSIRFETLPAPAFGLRTCLTCLVPDRSASALKRSARVAMYTI